MRAVVLCFSLVVVTCGATSFAQPSTAILGRTVSDVLPVSLRFNHCTVPNAMVLIARTTRIPAAIERLPGPCPPPPGPRAEDSLSLAGMTVAEAANALISLDKRYYWVESEGVLVVRPLAAWDDQEHFLHQAINGLSFDNEELGRAVLHVVSQIESGRPTKPAGFLQLVSSKRITLTTGVVSILQALEAIARSDGQLQIVVGYCTGAKRPEYAVMSVDSPEQIHSVSSRLAFPSIRPINDPCVLKH